jgi:hypothetical protein
MTALPLTPRYTSDPVLAAPYNAEHYFQEAVARILNSTGLVWFHPANERKCSVTEGGRLKKAGVKSGVPDCMILSPAPQYRDLSTMELGAPAVNGVAIELKSGTGVLSATQKQWKTDLEASGWAWYCIKTLGELYFILDRHYPCRTGGKL